MVARAKHSGVGRPHIQIAAKESCRGMAASSDSGGRKVNGVARYIQSVPWAIKTGVELEGETCN